MAAINGTTWEARPIPGRPWMHVVTFSGRKIVGLLEVSVRGDGTLWCDPKPVVRRDDGAEAYPRTPLGEFRINGRLVTESFQLERFSRRPDFYIRDTWGGLTDAANRALLPILEDISATLCTPEFAARAAVRAAESVALTRRGALKSALGAYREARAELDGARAALEAIIGA